MKCPTCKETKMKIVNGVMELDNVPFEAFKCNKCGGEILDMEQLKVLANKYRELRKAREITFSKWGNSLAIRIPSEMANEFNIKEGKHGLITREKDGIKIIPA